MSADDLRVIACDVDGTLTDSKQVANAHIVDLIAQLSRHVDVGLISGAAFSQFHYQILQPLPMDECVPDNIHVMTTCGTAYYRYIDGRWTELYSQQLSPDQARRTRLAIERCARRLGLWEDHTDGPAIDNRGSQITYSALGQRAPIARKNAWDPTAKKRDSLRCALQRELPDLQVRRGGSTSVDVTLKGVDKAYGIRSLMRYTHSTPDQVVYIGDNLREGGNDYPVIATGVTTIPVNNWHDSAEVLERYLAAVTNRPKNDG